MIFDKGAITIQWGKTGFLWGFWLFFQEIMLRKLNIHMKNNKVAALLYTTYKNLLKMDQRQKCKSQNYKTLRRKCRGKNS